MRYADLIWRFDGRYDVWIDGRRYEPLHDVEFNSTLWDELGQRAFFHLEHENFGSRKRPMDLAHRAALISDHAEPHQWIQGVLA